MDAGQGGYGERSPRGTDDERGLRTGHAGRAILALVVLAIVLLTTAANCSGSDERNQLPSSQFPQTTQISPGGGKHIILTPGGKRQAP